MKTNVLKRMEKQIANLTAAQQRVADLILKNPTEAAFMTLDQMAGAAGTSTTTVIRMAYSLGFSGFAEFQRTLQELLRDRVAPAMRFQANIKDLGHSRLLVRCAEKQIDNIKKTVELLSDDVLDSCVNLIIRSSKIYVIGARTSSGAANFLCHELNHILGKCQLLEPWSQNMVETIVSISPDDLIIAVSLPRYARSTVEIVSTIKEKKNAKVIAITDGYSAPVATFSDIVIPVAFSSLASHNSIVGPLFICDYLVTATALRQPEKTKLLLEEAETVFRYMDFHIEK